MDESTPSQSPNLNPDLRPTFVVESSNASPMPWKRSLSRATADALRLRASSPSSLADRLTAIGDRLSNRGDMKGAADAYSKAAHALGMGDKSTGTGADGARAWTDIMELAGDEGTRGG